MLYRLSNRQVKDLLISGVPLEIMLPAPPDDPPDWLEWSRNRIIGYGQYVTDAQPCSVRVVPRQVPRFDNLTDLIGTIILDDRKDFSFSVDAVSVLLDGPNIRNNRQRPQWPLEAVGGEMTWPLRQVASPVA